MLKSPAGSLLRADSFAGIAPEGSDGVFGRASVEAVVLLEDEEEDSCVAESEPLDSCPLVCWLEDDEQELLPKSNQPRLIPSTPMANNTATMETTSAMMIPASDFFFAGRCGGRPYGPG